MSDKHPVPLHGVPTEDLPFWRWWHANRPQPPAPGVGVRWQDRLKHLRDDGQ